MDQICIRICHLVSLPRLFKDGVLRSAADFTLGHGSGVQFDSDTDHHYPPPPHACFVLQLQRLPQCAVAGSEADLHASRRLFGSRRIPNIILACQAQR